MRDNHRPPDMDERQQAHALLDMLPASKLHTVRNLLELLVGRCRVRCAKVEDSEIAPGAARILEHSKASLAAGEGIPHEEVLREFGFDQ